MDKSRAKLNQLTSIRGIAAWWVVLFHSQAFFSALLPAFVTKIIAHGYLAVDLFFILSGFVIYFNYHGKVASGLPGSIIAFYANRFARIYPLHIIMLVGYLLLAVAFIYFSRSGTPPDSYNTRSFIESFFLIHAWFGTGMSWNVPSWSISAEWFVYLLFPFIALLSQKFLKEVYAHFAASIVILLVIYWVYSAMEVNSLGDDILGMALVRTFFEFLLGTVIGSLYVNHHAYLAKHKYVVLLAFVVTLLLHLIIDAPDYVLIPAAFFFLITFLCVENALLHKGLSNKALVYLGEISYATYMVHYLVYDLFKAGWVLDSANVNQIYLGLSFVVVLLLSMLMHHFVEMPSQKYLRNKLAAL